MKYWQAIKLSSREFKRPTGVKRQTFRLMVRLSVAIEEFKIYLSIAILSVVLTSYLSSY